MYPKTFFDVVKFIVSAFLSLNEIRGKPIPSHTHTLTHIPTHTYLLRQQYVDMAFIDAFRMSQVASKVIPGVTSKFIIRRSQL